MGTRKNAGGRRQRSKKDSEDFDEWIDVDNVVWSDASQKNRSSRRKAAGPGKGRAGGKGHTNGLGLSDGDALLEHYGFKKSQGLTNGLGLVNGLVNGEGLGKKGIKIKGPPKGKRAGKGRGNGQDPGRRKGLINGSGPSKRRGLVNGEGMVNGRGRVNGLATSLGFTNGVGRGKGLVNGSGLINGTYKIRGNGKAILKNKSRPVLKTLFILFVFLIPTLLFFYYIDDAEHISIDGRFGDWKGITKYTDPQGDLSGDPNIDIVEYAVDLDSDLVSFYLEVSGSAMEGEVFTDEAGLDTVQIFADTDRNGSTGYSIGGIGAEHMVEVSGYKGEVVDATHRSYDPEGRRQLDYNGWETVSGVKAEASGNRLETQFWVPGKDRSAGDVDVYFLIGDHLGNQDASDGAVSTREGVLVVEQRSIAADILGQGLKDVVELSLTARGSSITVESVDITNHGAGVVQPVRTPFTLEKDATFTRIIKLDTSKGAPEALIDVGISSPESIKTDKGRVSLSGKGAKAYLVRPPDLITVDGAFGDWARFGPVLDTDEEPVGSANVNLNEYRIARQVSGGVSFYLSVQGQMMGGTRVPILPRFLSLLPPPPPAGGPAGGPSSGNIDPILPELTAEDTISIFLDTDDDRGTGYALASLGPGVSDLGADRMIKITGKNGDISASGLYIFDGSFARDWSWTYAGPAKAGNDGRRLEAQMVFSELGLGAAQEFGVWFYAHDWNKASEDGSRDIILPGAVGAPSAPPIPPDPSEDEVAGGDEGTVEEDPIIRLQADSFDPLTEKPEVDPDLISEVPNGYYIVQFTGPIQEEWKLQVADMGATFYGYIPEYAFIVRTEDPERLNPLPFVRWMGNYHPAYKVQQGILEQQEGGGNTIELDVLVFKDRDMTGRRIENLGGTIVSRWDGKLCINISRERVPDVLLIPEVEWVEESPVFELSNDKADDVGRLNVNTVWTSPYQLNGTGQIVAVCDTGIDTGVNDNTMHDDIEGRIKAIYDSLGGNADGTSDVASGHGSHVAGSVLGNGSRSSGLFKGMAPCASLVFQASEYKSGNSYFLDLPSDLNTLFQQAYNADARIHTNSWGSSSYGAYNSYSQDLDEFTWANRDMLILFSAGNDGTDGNSDGVVDTDSMQSPATAKNSLTVGATESQRSNGYTGTWGAGWPADYPSNPINSDRISNSSEGMAAFSSRGPCDDGRIKPDVVAPGTNIVSVRSSLATTGLWGNYNTWYEWSGGTSMSTPLVAGCSALVRQFYTDNESLASPSGPLIKATLINGAKDINGQYAGAFHDAGPIPNMNEGWGMVNVTNSLFPPEPREMTYRDVTSGFTATDQKHTYKYRVGTKEPFKVTMVYNDYPASTSSGALVNDLDLKVTAPDGTTFYLGNDFTNGWTNSGGSTADDTNNVECVYIKSPTAGTWTIEVDAQNIATLGSQSDQDYALVLSGNFTFPNDVGVEQIQVNNTQLKDTKVRIDATIMNYGKLDQAGPFATRCVVKGPKDNEVLNSVRYITSLSSKTSVVKDWYYTPDTEGVYTVTVTTELKADDYNDNNESSTAFTVPVYLNEIAAMTGASANDLFGFNVTSGKLNDDNYADVVVGAPGANTAYVFYGYPSMTGTLSASSANVTIPGPDSSSGFGWSVGVSDITGDGYDDIIVGAPGYSSETGRAYIFHSSSTGVPDTTADVTITGGDTGDRFGCSVSGAGDVNSSDNEDVIIGAYLNDTLNGTRADAGMAYVFFGDSELTGTLSAADADVNLSGKEAGDHFGFSVSSASNVNNDAYDDMIVGAPGADRAYIFYGGPGMWNSWDGVIPFSEGFESNDFDTNGWTVVGANSVTDWKIWPTSTYSSNSGSYSAGSVITGSGFGSGDRIVYVPVDARGRKDLQVQYYYRQRDNGAPNYACVGEYSVNGGGSWTQFETDPSSSSWSLRGPFTLPKTADNNPALRIRFRATVSGSSASTGDRVQIDDISITGTFIPGTAVANVTLIGENDNDRFGWSVNSSGNVNGDSYDDVVVGAPSYSASTGRAYVFKGSGSLANSILASNADVKLNGAAEGDGFGFSVGAADMGADGYADVLVGAPYNDTIDGSIANAGAVFVFNGSASMVSEYDAEDCTRYGETADDHFGWSVFTAGDVNLDTYDDIVVGAPHYSSDTGKAYILTTQDVTPIPEFYLPALPVVVGLVVFGVRKIVNKKRRRNN